MKTVVAAPEDLWDELSTTLKTSNCVRVESPAEFEQYTSDDIFFNLFEGAEKKTYLNNNNGLIFINSTNATLNESNQPANIYRLNSWNGFLKRDKWEVAGVAGVRLIEYCNSINKEVIVCPDIPGFISCRIISMIINEAYFTLAEGVSTKPEIDVAMKLGTNYPKGPFEWSDEIGLNKVLQLLIALSKEDERYTPAPMLIKDCK